MNILLQSIIMTLLAYCWASYSREMGKKEMKGTCLEKIKRIKNDNYAFAEDPLARGRTDKVLNKLISEIENE